MRSVRLMVLCTATIGLVSTSVGCQLFPYELQPHQLWKLNRGSSFSEDPFFSVPDPIPQAAVEPLEPSEKNEWTSTVTTLDTTDIRETSLTDQPDDPFAQSE